jgi:4-alpha-glucanotransferase
MSYERLNLSLENKIAGVLVPLFALRREHDLGIGDVGALREFIDWAAAIGFKLVQLLPINETGADNSPYNAISAMAIEPTTLHLAPNSPQDLTPEDFDTLVADVDLANLRQGGVKYRNVKKLKRSLLEKAFANFSARAGEERRLEFRTFCEEQAAWLHFSASCLRRTTTAQHGIGGQPSISRSKERATGCATSHATDKLR